MVEGADEPGREKPEHLILDGQQRLTSLYLAIQFGKPVPTKTSKGEEIERFYYLDMALCLDPEADRTDAVVSVPADRRVTADFGRRIELDVSTREKEYEACLFPLAIAFSPAEFTERKMGFHQFHGFDPEKSKFLMRFENDIWLRFQQYKIPVVKILKDTPKEAVCQVFERVNTGGVTLSVFEMVTAAFAAEEFSLREDWEEKERELHEYDVLKEFDATSFLTAVTLLASFQRYQRSEGAVGCMRKDVLNLSLEDYLRLAGSIMQGLKDAALLLAGEKIFDARSLPYTTQLIPLSAICAHLGKRFEEVPIKQKIKRWYWSGVLGELYGGANETRFATDMQDVISVVDRGRGAQDHQGRQLQPGASAQPADEEQRGLQGHLCASYAAGQQGFSQRRSRGADRLFRPRHRHPSRLSPGVLRENGVEAIDMEQRRQQGPPLWLDQPDDRRACALCLSTKIRGGEEARFAGPRRDIGNPLDRAVLLI